MDAAPELLTAADAPPVEHVNAAGKAPVLVTCDHASRRVPKSLRNLGLDAESLKLHIAWDIGAADVSRHLARKLDAPAILAGYSRLVIDCNRDIDDPTAMPAVSDGVPVPGNKDLSSAAGAQRVEVLFKPYHAAIEAALDGFTARGVHPAVLSIHSFTPVMNDFARPWHIGILWDKDPRMAIPMLAALRRETGLVVGDNEPYSAREPAGYTVRTHAEKRGLPHLNVELRQDLLATDAGTVEWADRLVRVLTPILEDPALYHVKHY
ncbi:MAG TPA: N-formylglutamate amidohydrolase [Stellaceae bacterium]|nr:N-formylglutamate amidohydrolase [Stellaceae bacterium]